MECFLELSYWPSSLSCQLRSITSQIPSTSSCGKGSWNQDSALIRKGPVWMGLLVPLLVNLVPVQTCTESQGRYTYCKRMRHEWKEWDANSSSRQGVKGFPCYSHVVTGIHYCQSQKWEKNVSQRQRSEAKEHNLFCKEDDVRNRIEFSSWDTDYAFFSLHVFCHSGWIPAWSRHSLVLKISSVFPVPFEWH